MPQSQKSGPKIPTTQTNTNRKKRIDPSQNSARPEVSMFRKNEFALIVFGALLLTLIVFFLFFTGPKESLKESAVSKQVESAPSFAALEKRISALEKALNGQNTETAGSDAEQGGKKTGIALLNTRMARIETAFEVKFESLADKMAAFENQLEQMQKTVSASALQKVPVQPASKPTAAPVKKAQKTKTKAKAPMFHTVKKGETPYSIAKQYKITVDKLLSLNKMSKTAKIYPGMNLMIR